jgi:hypothetical protein
MATTWKATFLAPDGYEFETFATTSSEHSWAGFIALASSGSMCTVPGVVKPALLKVEEVTNEEGLAR